jgi:hypothetical protein
VARSSHAFQHAHCLRVVPREIRHPPRSFAEQVFNIQRWTEMPCGGHLAAVEAPDLLATDVTIVLPLAPRALIVAQSLPNLAVCDVPPRRAMYLLGHTDPKLTLAVYQQVIDMGRGSIEILEQALGCTLAEARAIFNGEGPQPRVSGTKPEPSMKKASAAGHSRTLEA